MSILGRASDGTAIMPNTTVPDAATADMPASSFAPVGPANASPAPMDVVNEISKQLTGQPLGDLASNVGILNTAMQMGGSALQAYAAGAGKATPTTPATTQK